MKRWWREELQLPVTIKQGFLNSYKWKKYSSDIGSFDSFRSKFFAKVISCLKSFSVNEYALRILSSVFLIEMFDLRGKGQKYAKELLLNQYRKSVQNYMWLQDMWVKPAVTNHFRKIFRSRIHKTAERNTAARKIRIINWNQFLILSQTFCYWDNLLTAK